MLKNRIVAVLVLGLILGAAVLGAENPSGSFFNVFIEQDGGIIEIDDFRVLLAKRPFTLILELTQPMGILVNFSFDGSLARGFNGRQSLDELLPEPDLFMGMAEEMFNPDAAIYIDVVSPHYLFYNNSEEHRFSDVDMAGNSLLCRRDIGYFKVLGLGESLRRIEELDQDSLFVSLLYSEFGEDWRRIEKQKRGFQILFQD